MIMIEAEVEFAMAHRLMAHPGKCAAMHGHNYRWVVMVVRDNGPDPLTGMVMDFKALKGAILLVADTFDHRTLLQKDDVCLSAGESVVHMDKAPTAENMLLIMVGALNRILPDGVHVVESRLYETTRCAAVYRR